jgi:hypothetical protein
MFEKPHRQLQYTLQLVCEDRVLFELIFTSLYAGNSIQNASGQFVSCIHLYLLNFALHWTPQKNLTELGLYIQTALSQ